MDAARLEQVRLRMTLAREKLAVARELFGNRHFNDTVSKAYYAMFHASRALLLAVGEDPHKHAGVVSLFGERFVKPGLTAARFGRTLAIAQRLRETSDYDEYKHATQDEAQQAIQDAADFIREAERILNRLLSGE